MSSSSSLGSLGRKPARILQVCSASLSFLASAAMAFMIILPVNGRGLSKPYRRIIFGLSISDMLQSMALITGPWMLPISSNDEYAHDANTWGIGNENTCRVNGFIATIGSEAMPMYICLLCAYYLCNLKYRMTDDEFYFEIERKAHAAIVIFVLMMATCILLSNSFHPHVQETFCFIGNSPRGCEFVPELVGPCDERIKFYNTLFSSIDSFAVPVVSFVAIAIIMWLMVVHALRLTNNNGDTNYDEEGNTGSQEEESVDSIQLDDGSTPRATDDEGFPVLGERPATASNAHDINVSNRVQLGDQVGILSELYRNETIMQATLYVGVFIYTYGSVVFLCLLNWLRIVPPLYLQIIVLSTCPFVGFFNILVYTRPKISHLRRTYPECSWWKGLVLVIRAGGEIPDSLECEICCLKCRSQPDIRLPDRTMHRQEGNEESVPGLSYDELSRPGIEQRRRPVVISSALGIDGLSMSFGESERGDYNPKEKWKHLIGTESSREYLSTSSFDYTNDSGDSMIKNRTIAIVSSTADPLPITCISDLTTSARMGSSHSPSTSMLQSELEDAEA